MNPVLEAERSLLAGSTVVIACAEPRAELERQISTSIQLGARYVVVDLGDAEMVESATLATLKALAGRLRSLGGRLSVVAASPGLSHLLHLTLLSHSFRVFDSLDAALATSR